MQQLYQNIEDYTSSIVGKGLKEVTGLKVHPNSISE
jgi:hypothetical protein